MLNKSTKNADHTVVRFENKVFFDNLKLCVSNLTDSSLQNKKNRLDCALFCCKAFFKQLECSRSGEKHSTTSRVSPYSSFVL